MRAAITAACLVASWLLPAEAQEQPPLDPGAPEGAVRTASVERDFDRYALPVAPFGPDPAASLRQVEGRVSWSGFRLDDHGASAADVIAGYRTRLRAMGFSPLLDCANAACGGFDFQFAVSLLRRRRCWSTPPAVRSAFGQPGRAGGQRDGGVGAGQPAARAIDVQTVVVSPARPGQIITASPPPETDPAIPLPILPGDGGSLLDRLANEGHATVEGIAFETGGAALSKETSARPLTIWRQCSPASPRFRC